MRIRILLPTLIASGNLLVAAPPADVHRLDGTTISPAEIDSTVARLMRAAEVTGVGVSVLNNGKVVFSKGYGLRDVDRKLPLSPDTVLGGASLTKPAFACLAMQLVAEGTLNLDRPVFEYLPKPLPDYPEYRDLAGDPRYRRITARMLLSHTAGFANLRWLEPDRKLKIHFEPGSRYAYSGEGIQLMQLVVETVTGKQVRDLMRDRVFVPLGMTRTSMVSEERFADDLANGYDEWGRSLGPQRRQTASAAGSMQTTLGDYTRFVQAVAIGKWLPKAAREEMLRPQIRIVSARQFPTLAEAVTTANDGIRLSYGLGWGLYFTPRGKVFFKEGHDEGFRNYTAVFDKTRDGIVILTNSSNGEGIFKELIETLTRNTFTPIEWEGYTSYDRLPPRQPLPVHTEITLEPAQLDRLTGRYGTPPELIVTIARSGGHLTIRENQEAPGELFPEGEFRFFSKTSDDVIVFEPGPQGRIARFVLFTGGRSFPVNRIE